jgi:hypothetical protein
MKKLIVSVLCALCTLAFVAVAPSFADEAAGVANGVLIQERVLTLPQDQAKWYVSVVGDDSATRVLGWFESNAGLKKLKAQVHFKVVKTDTAIFTERYAPNIKALPTIRMQKSDGTVVYEAAGKNIPMTAAGLYGAMADAARSAQDIRPLLPWRRDIDNRCQPRPDPNVEPVDPNVEPADPNVDPNVDPVDPNVGPPDFEDPVVVNPYLYLPIALIGSLVAGLALGYGKKLYQHIHPS